MTPKERVQTPEQVNPLKKVLIANRGEIAVRGARTFLERGIPAVVPYSLEDEDALVVNIAERNIDKGWELAPIGGRTEEESYANPKKMLETAKFYDCDAIFLGYGFLSENAEFVASCEKEGIRVLAPPSPVMDTAGNKIKAREATREIRFGRFLPPIIPILEGSSNLETVDQATRAAHHFGFPIILKDPNLGGGRGNAIVRNEVELKTAYERLKTGKETQLFMERYIQNAAHVEIQIAADKYGNVVALGERDCTMQRRSQKIIEESPSPIVSDRMRKKMQQAAKLFARRIDYTGVGTWEFIVDNDRRDKNGDPEYYFMEVNPRIQVEHCVTEEQTGVDIVGLMIDIAEGKKLPITQQQIDERLQGAGHTIEVRVYAEDPKYNFQSISGEVSKLTLPEIDGIRVETGIKEGDKISPWYDNTVCKVIAHTQTRQQAIEKLTDYLSKMQVEGVPTNKEMLSELLNTNEFLTGRSTTTFIEQWWNRRLKEQTHSIGEFINGGNFTPYRPSYMLDTDKLPQDIAVRNRKGEVDPYSKKLAKEKAKTKKDCAAEYGVLERDGVRSVLYHLDYEFLQGTLGKSEGLVFMDACRLAHDLNLPLVTIVSSGGARQDENTIALSEMGFGVHNLNYYPPPYHINIYTGPVYGGLPASIAGVADIQIAVNSSRTKIGFSGPQIVADAQGLEPEGTTADDAYKVLPPGTHTPKRHYDHRNIDILVSSLAEASDKATHIAHNLGLKSTIANPNSIFQLREITGLINAAAKPLRFDQQDNAVHALWGKVKGMLWERNKPAHGELVLPHYDKLPIGKRLELLTHPERPTPADILDTNLGIFDDVVLLTNPPSRVNGIEHYHPIIAALARRKDKTMLVLGQQTQRALNMQTKKWERVYDPQKPVDWDYMERMIEFGKKLKLPILLLGDTLGADCRIEAEDDDQSHKIGHILEIIDLYPYAVLSGNLGFKGSGGGETFIRPLDGAFSLENAGFAVSTLQVQYWIMTGRRINESSSTDEKREFQEFIEKLTDATAETQLKLNLIDIVIPEGRGGAHNNPRIMAFHLRQWLDENLNLLSKIRPDELKERRHQRVQRAQLLQARRVA